MKIFFLIVTFLTSVIVTAQLKKDLDYDGKLDYVDLNDDYAIVCKLSSQNYKAVKSRVDVADGMVGNISPTKNGFSLYVSFNRGDHAMQFRYEPKEKKIRLIGMRYSYFGPANNDGSGDGSVNLLTNSYIGEWNYFSLQENQLIKLPTIKKKMTFPKIYLETFDYKYFYQFQEKSDQWSLELRDKAKKME